MLNLWHGDIFREHSSTFGECLFRFLLLGKHHLDDIAAAWTDYNNTKTAHREHGHLQPRYFARRSRSLNMPRKTMSSIVCCCSSIERFPKKWFVNIVP